MRIKFDGNKADKVIVTVKDADTVNIVRGTPLVLVLNGTDDGLGVVLPSTAGALKSIMFGFGVANDLITPNQFGEATVFGYNPYSLVTLATRSASSASWSSSAAMTITGQALSIDTINNAFGTVASTAANGLQPYAVLIDTVASIAASASNVTDTRTAIVSPFRTFMRQM